jgi:hypothetical protein
MMRTRDLLVVLFLSPSLLVLGAPGLIFALLIWVIFAIWFAHVVWSFLGGIR